MSLVKPPLEPAAGFSLESRPSRPDRVPLAKGQYSVASRALALSTYFLSGALAINLSQFLGSPLKVINEDWYNAWIAFTKQSFGLLTMTLTQTFAPTKVIVSGDESVRGQLLKSVDGNLILDFPERIVLMANHQIYTDWLYLWWIAYCNGMHGRLYIILKESLRKIPVLGWGMQLSQFIFLKRNWEEDRPNMASALQKLNKPTDPMWLLLFPEGTNLAPTTRQKSAAWAKKNNIPDTRHVLLPRSTGLQFCLEELKGTVDYLYDCTVVYEGVPRGQYAQDIFTLQSGYLEGRPPKSVSMYWRRFAVRDIPLHDEKVFALWLTARWREKDLLIEHYYQNGSFPADRGATKYKSGKVLRGCGHMEVPIRASHWYEFLQIFAPMGILAMILYVFYGDLPQRFWKSINKEALQSGTEDLKKAGVQAGREAKSVSNALGGLTLDSFFEPAQQQETFKAGMMAVEKLLNSPSAQTLLNRGDFLQQFLSDPQKMVTDSITDKQQSFMQQLAMEEAKRMQGSVTNVGTGPLKPITNGAIPATPPKGSFWDELQAEEKSRHGSVVSVPTSAASKHSQGTFWKDLKAAEKKKNAPPVTNKGNFWNAMKAEENSRYGTVVTLSSDASTAVASVNSSSSKSVASGPKKAAGSGAVSRPKASSIQPSSVSAKKAPSISSVTNAAAAPKTRISSTPVKQSTVATPASTTSKKAVKPKTNPSTLTTTKPKSSSTTKNTVSSKPTPKSPGTAISAPKATPSSTTKPTASSSSTTLKPGPGSRAPPAKTKNTPTPKQTTGGSMVAATKPAAAPLPKTKPTTGATSTPNTKTGIGTSTTANKPTSKPAVAKAGTGATKPARTTTIPTLKTTPKTISKTNVVTPSKTATAAVAAVKSSSNTAPPKLKS